MSELPTAGLRASRICVAIGLGTAVTVAGVVAPRTIAAVRLAASAVDRGCGAPRIDVGRGISAGSCAGRGAAEHMEARARQSGRDRDLLST